MNIKNIELEVGYVTITPSEGAPYRVPIADFLGAGVTSTVLINVVGVTSDKDDLNLLSAQALVATAVVKVYEEEVDCSGGGSAQTEALITLPLGSVIIEIATVCTEAFDGDTTKTFEVGITGNTDKYIDPVDCPVTLNGVMYMFGGTNNDQQNPECVASTPLKATWTNDANATAGKMKVRVVYV